MTGWTRAALGGLALLAMTGVILPQQAHADRWRHCDTPNGYYPRPNNWNPYIGGGGWNHGGYQQHDVQFNSNYWNNAIAHEYREGDLSRDEVRRLQREQEHIQRDRARFLSDGYLSPREREDLREDIHDFRKDFRHQVTDDEYRY